MPQRAVQVRSLERLGLSKYPVTGSARRGDGQKTPAEVPQAPPIRSDERAGSYHAKVLGACQISWSRSKPLSALPNLWELSPGPAPPDATDRWHKGQRLGRCLPQSGASTSALLGLRSLLYRRVDSERRIGGDGVQAALGTMARPVFLAANAFRRVRDRRGVVVGPKDRCAPA